MASKNVETLRASHESWNKRDFAGVVKNAAEKLTYTDNARAEGDLYPAWRDRNARPCRKEDREAILSSLKGAKVKRSHVTPVCIQEELEAWRIADGRALSAVLSTQAHPVRVSHENRPERVRNPKRTLLRLFNKSRLRTYVDRYHAIQIVRALPDLGRLSRLPSFQRFSRNFLIED